MCSESAWSHDLYMRAGCTGAVRPLCLHARAAVSHQWNSSSLGRQLVCWEVSQASHRDCREKKTVYVPSLSTLSHMKMASVLSLYEWFVSRYLSPCFRCDQTSWGWEEAIFWLGGQICFCIRLQIYSGGMCMVCCWRLHTVSMITVLLSGRVKWCW